MNKEPENLSSEELLRIENLQLKRQLLEQQDGLLIRDIAAARCLDAKEYGQTWMVQEGRILTLAPAEQEEQIELDAKP